MNELLHQKELCKSCPFLKNCMPLGGEKMMEVYKTDAYLCSHTTEENTMYCAGHMLLLKYCNTYYRRAKFLNIELELTGQDQVFHRVRDWVDHHLNEI
ncbi:hypothetical protein [Chondrinema litorale]|uniref:hypothetical protein n=1 Tax=Chondrinema litorale TaxID=2994555 RepID=UPI0025428E8C|nr:hypothetical protein [Chondrinema litorale]UZR95952.1 hypothetical protein OQ292_09015 [Chondrinema litorale]